MPANLLSPLAHAGAEERGAVFTRPEVAEAVLDLAGYDPRRDLSSLKLLEPCCGEGSFLLPAARKLWDSYRRHGETRWMR